MKKAPGRRPYRQMSGFDLVKMFLISLFLVVLGYFSLWCVPATLLGMVFLLFTIDEWTKPTREQWERGGERN